MKVSIVVPAYNSSRYIDRCLISLKNQTYKDVEIIIVNDGSTDDTPNLVAKHLALDSRMKLVDQENSGTHLARLNGIKKSKGEVILNVDSDDYLELNAIQLLVDKMVETNADIVIANYYQHRSGVKRLMKSTIPSSSDKIDAIKFMLLGDISIYLWGKLFKRYLLEKVDLPIKRVFTEDVLTNFYILCNFDVVLALVEEPVLNYIVHDSNISYSRNKDVVEGYYHEFGVVEQMLKDKDLYSQVTDELSLYKAIMWIDYCRKGGQLAKDSHYHKIFYDKHYPLAKQFLPSHFKMEMYIYSKNLWLGKMYTKLMFWVHKQLAISGIMKMS